MPSNPQKQDTAQQPHQQHEQHRPLEDAPGPVEQAQAQPPMDLANKASATQEESTPEQAKKADTKHQAQPDKPSEPDTPHPDASMPVAQPRLSRRPSGQAAHYFASLISIDQAIPCPIHTVNG